jgi:hypothetical protein
VANGEDKLPLEVMFDFLIPSSFQQPFIPSQEELFGVFNCNHIKDAIHLFKLLGMSDLEVLHVKNLELSITLS